MVYRFELANGHFTEWVPLIEGAPYHQPDSAKNIWFYRAPWKVAIVEPISR